MTLRFDPRVWMVRHFVVDKFRKVFRPDPWTHSFGGLVVVKDD